jgi:hypothetical protein
LAVRVDGRGTAAPDDPDVELRSPRCSVPE